jgi:rSAM/selenodomain-associated transferase 1
MPGLSAGTRNGMHAEHRVLDPEAGVQVSPGLCALGVMTKVPRAGRVKTRLTPPLTPEEAAGLNTCFLRDTTNAIAAVTAEGLASGVGVYTPVGEESAYADILPEEFELVAQRGDAFGERLTLAGEDLLRVGFSSFCLIDSDSPTVPQHAYADAARLLSEPGDRMVLGPSDDGGYYLIGLKQSHRRVFEEIDWSTERVAEQTLQRAREIGLEVHLLPTWYDVDDRATLHRLCNELLGDSATGGYAAPETRNFLAAIIDREGRERIYPVNA